MAHSKSNNASHGHFACGFQRFMLEDGYLTDTSFRGVSAKELGIGGSCGETVSSGRRLHIYRNVCTIEANSPLCSDRRLQPCVRKRGSEVSAIPLEKYLPRWLNSSVLGK